MCVCRAVLYNHMKLMFVGVESIGKTSLLMELRKEGRPDASDKTKVTLTPRATCRVCTRQVSARILINFVTHMLGDRPTCENEKSLDVLTREL